MSSELAIGDRVRLAAPDLMLPDGSVVFEEANGLVVGFKGFDGVIVSWGDLPPYRSGECRRNDLIRSRLPKP